MSKTSTVTNLIPLNKRTMDERREIARKGGIASGKSRSLKATMIKMIEDENLAEELCRVAIDEARKGNPVFRKLIADMTQTNGVPVPFDVTQPLGIPLIPSSGEQTD